MVTHHIIDDDDDDHHDDARSSGTAAAAWAAGGGGGVSGGAGRRRQRTLRQFRAVAPSLSTIDEAVETRLDDAVVPQLDVKRRRLVESAVETRVDDAAVETQQQDDGEQVRGDESAVETRVDDAAVETQQQDDGEQVRGDERRSSISSDAAAQVMDRAEMRGAGEVVVVVVADEMQTRDGLAAARSSDDDAETARDCARLDETGPDRTAADRSSDDERAMAERVIVVATTCEQLAAAAAAGESETAPVTAGIPVGTAAAAGDDGATGGDVTGSRWRRVLRSAAVTSPRCHGDQDAGSRDGGAGKFVVGLRRRRQ